MQLYEDLLPKNCSDSRLSAEDKFFCRRCCSLTTRAACLGSIGRRWHDGAGEPAPRLAAVYRSPCLRLAAGQAPPRW